MKNSDLHRPLLHILLVIIISLLAYSNTFDAPFLFDDTYNIISNPIIKDLRNYSDPSRTDEISDLRAYPMFKKRFIGSLTFALNYSLHGLDVTGYHIVNFLIHMCNALLVYLFITLSFKTPFLIRSFIKDYSKYIALFSALFFACHPIQTQAVTYIVQRFTSLAAMFYLLSLVSYIKWRLLGLENRYQRFFVFKSVFFYLTAVISAVLAMNTKEFSFTLPIIICTYEFMFFEEKMRKRVAYLIPFLLTMSIIPLNLLNVGGSLAHVTRLATDMSRWDYLFTQFTVIVTYIGLIFFPLNQNVDYDFPIYHSFFESKVLMSFAFLMAFFTLAVYLFYRYRASAPYTRLISFGIFWLFITLSVESSVIPILDVIVEHRMYLPSIGLFIAITTSIFIVAEKLNNKGKKMDKTIIGALILTVVVLTGLTYARNGVWKDEVTLWEDAVSKSPKNARAHNNLGKAYGYKGALDKAIGHLETSINIKSDNPEAHYNLALGYFYKGMDDKAIKHFKIALKLHPNYSEAYNNLGVVLLNKGLKNEAIEQIEIALKINPYFPSAYLNLGNAYQSLGFFDMAMKQYQLAIKLVPNSPLIHYNIGTIYQLKGSINKAIEHYRLAIQFKPDYQKAHHNLGNAYMLQNLPEKAIKEYHIAIKQNPADFDVYYSLGDAYKSQGLIDKATESYKTARELQQAGNTQH